MKRSFPNQLRRPKAHLSPYIMNYLYERNPWPIVWWSAAFPGSGHMALCKYVTGVLLMVWEFFLNLKAHINEAIFYSMIGEFDVAKAVIDTRWFLLYSGMYIFIMWDCYSNTIDLNKYALLSSRLKSPIRPFNIGAFEINYLDYRKPWNGAFWSFLTPGLGSVYTNKLPMGFFGLICFIITAYQSNVLSAIHLTFMGKPDQAAGVINPQWFLNLPSIILFQVSYAYNDILFTNQLFKIEQSRYFQDNFQPPSFKMPLNNGKETIMHFISAFQHSAFLELALCDLEQRGILKENIFVAPLKRSPLEMPDVDKAHKEDTTKFEAAFMLGAIFMLLGGIYGFILAWGPIIWSLIGLVVGGLMGYGLSSMFQKAKRRQKKSETEVVLIVKCEKDESDFVERLLWQNKAIGVMKYPEVST